MKRSDYDVSTLRIQGGCVRKRDAKVSSAVGDDRLQGLWVGGFEHCSAAILEQLVEIMETETDYACSAGHLPRPLGDLPRFKARAVAAKVMEQLKLRSDCSTEAPEARL